MSIFSEQGAQGYHHHTHTHLIKLNGGDHQVIRASEVIERMA